MIYMSSESNVVGSFLFSFGLITIVLRGYLLYTGKIGYVWDKEILKLIPIILIGNLLGTTLLACFVPETSALIAKSVALTEPKLVKSLWQIVFDSVGCGAMMYLAVDNYRKSKSWLFIIFPIVIFILSGFEHSIANMFYLSLADAWGWEAVRLTVIGIIGNAVGSWLVNAGNFLLKEKEE